MVEVEEDSVPAEITASTEPAGGTDGLSLNATSSVGD